MASCNKMRNKIICAATVLLMLPVAISLRAQVQGGDSFATRLEQAKELYNSGMYVSAERELEALADDLPDKHSLLYSEVMANKIMCAIALGRKDVDGLVKNLEVDFPNDPQLAVLKMNLADAKFDSQDYTRQGLPAAIVLSGISLVTTLPAPITALSPMVTPCRTVTFAPSHTFLPICIGLAIMPARCAGSGI